MCGFKVDHSEAKYNVGVGESQQTNALLCNLLRDIRLCSLTFGTVIRGPPAPTLRDLHDIFPDPIHGLMRIDSSSRSEKNVADNVLLAARNGLEPIPITSLRVLRRASQIFEHGVRIEHQINHCSYTTGSDGANTQTNYKAETDVDDSK